MMATLTLPSTLDMRLLIQVGDNEPIELGTIEAPGVTAHPLPGGEPGVELRYNARKFRRIFRRTLRAMARAIR
ncbi:hypothetical protein SEA_FUZZBUSTER_29 [Microbacterium phage FuzzBuster]|uniref:Uncharacterized protein n=1 Tax=Microbacterium phage FuzzBuster TaxID=2590935 RepID=A0A516KV01_9CAUD|nr:hypothetical protein SEA_FUZZBUSTER_29 [Microbacterium phage FuzzBuster]